MTPPPQPVARQPINTRSDEPSIKERVLPQKKTNKKGYKTAKSQQKTTQRAFEATISATTVNKGEEAVELPKALVCKKKYSKTQAYHFWMKFQEQNLEAV